MELEIYKAMMAEMNTNWEAFDIIRNEQPGMAKMEADIGAAEIRLRLLEGRYQHEKNKEKKRKSSWKYRKRSHRFLIRKWKRGGRRSGTSKRKFGGWKKNLK